LFKQVNYSLSKLIQDIEIGEIGLPDIQRPFVWTSTKVRDLFDSMYKGFPVGYLLFWSNAVSGMNRVIGTDTKQKTIPRLLIVDGQQRLTSLYAVLKNISVKRHDYTDQRITIAFRPKDGRFEVTDAVIVHDPEYIPNISDLWSGNPSRNRFVRDFIQKLRQHRIVMADDEEDRLTEAIDRLYDLQNYPFTALELSTTVDEEHVAEVFVRINSQGVTLNQADFILTLMSVFWDEGRSQLERFCSDSRQPSTQGDASPFNYFMQPEPDEMLRVSVALGFRRAILKFVYSILRGKDLETGQFHEEKRIEQFKILEQAQSYVLNLKNWHEFLKILLQAGFRSSSMITSRNGLLYSYAMFLIGQRDFGIDHRELRNIISRWFFMISLSGRYTGTPEGVMESDLIKLRDSKDAKAFIETLDGIIRNTLTEDFWNITLPNDLATSAARSPSLFAYYASLNIHDARVLFSKIKVAELLDPALRSTKSAIERHHLFPKKYLEKIGITETKDVNQIANFALVEWPDNIDISNLSPAEYFPKYASHMSDEMRYWYGLPQGWEHMKYNDFLAIRRKSIARVIHDGFNQLSNMSAPLQLEEYVDPTLEELIKKGESNTIEFKSSMRWDYNVNQKGTDMGQLAILKTIAAFMNSEGGTLIVDN
jgi:hypothetical protein